MADLSFDHEIVKISDITIDTSPIQNHTYKKVVNHATINDEMLAPHTRFWHSLCSRFSGFGITNNLYSLFDHDEVFNRLTMRSPNDRVRVTIQRQANRVPILLAATSPDKPLIGYEALLSILTKFHGEHITYCDGVVTSWHTPSIGGHRYTLECPFTGLKEDFENRYLLEVPIDAYGKPSIFPSVERVNDCTRWVTRHATSLKTEITMGKGLDVVAHAVARVLDSYNTDDGYATLRNRLEIAIRSWASVYEVNEAYKLITRLMSKLQIIDQNQETVQSGGGLISQFHAMTGDTSKIWGLTTLEALAAKRQRSLPVNCTMYQLLGFLAVAATFEAKPQGAAALHGMIGMLMGSDAGYDLECLRTKFQAFSDFQLRASLRDVLDGKISLTE